MTRPQDLPDEALLALSLEWRRRVMSGIRSARAYTNALENEIRTRFGPSREP